MIRFLTSGIAICLLAACDPHDWADPHRGSVTFNGEMRAQSPESCTQKGSEWKPVCMAQEPACVTPFPDAGQTCSDGSDCVGECLAEVPVDNGAKTTGVCQRDDNPCGTFTRIINGRAEIGLAVD